jgi:hypothetical protein
MKIRVLHSRRGQGRRWLAVGLEAAFAGEVTSAVEDGKGAACSAAPEEGGDIVAAPDTS